MLCMQYNIWSHGQSVIFYKPLSSNVFRRDDCLVMNLLLHPPCTCYTFHTPQLLLFCSWLKLRLIDWIHFYLHFLTDSRLELESASRSGSSPWWIRIHERCKTWVKFFCLGFVFLPAVELGDLITFALLNLVCSSYLLQCLHTLFFMRIFWSVLESPCTAHF